MVKWAKKKPAVALGEKNNPRHYFVQVSFSTGGNCHLLSENFINELYICP